MGAFEFFDLISGVSASGGPNSFLDDEEEREELADGLAEKIIAAAKYPNLPRKDEIKQILVDALVYVSSDAEDDTVLFLRSWHDPAVVIGIFEGGDSENIATIRYCDRYNMYGGFDALCDHNGEWVDESTQLYSTGFLFMDSRCWHYIQAWVSRPRGWDKSLAQELHDTFTDDVNGPSLGLSNNLDYGLMKHMNGQFQDTFLQNCLVDGALETLCLDEAPNLSRALSSGLRGRDLVPALFIDFQVWIFESPDIWPHKPEIQFENPLFRHFAITSQASPKLLTLPLELLLQILSSLSLADIVHVSSASKDMRQLVIQPGILPLLLRELVTSPSGSLRWLQPCSLVEGEVENANIALRSWIKLDYKDPLQAQEFPFVEFVHACMVQSASMKNRRRIWRMIKQVEAMLFDRI
ncbi:hypothetical protein DL96DRAFT_1589130 [Flagelloscypha sp. PMI_526]|nr:hypothetical protein DL96DRAFT_1589130 [Flagelloscypha sp. PMI_526]